jgi:hypothetical protein
MEYMVYYILLGISLWILKLFFSQMARNRRLAEDRNNSIFTEIRKRAAHQNSQSKLSKYTDNELEIIKGQLRDIAYKRKLGHKLLDSEKLLLKRFPESYQITSRKIGK